MIRLISEIMRPVRFASVETFETHRSAVNERLMLSGYVVREDGKVTKTIIAVTLSEAQQRADALACESQPVEIRGRHRLGRGKEALESRDRRRHRLSGALDETPGQGARARYGDLLTQHRAHRALERVPRPGNAYAGAAA